MVCNHLIRRGMSKYEAVYFVGDNQANNRIRVDSYKMRNRGAFSGLLAALITITFSKCQSITITFKFQQIYYFFYYFYYIGPIPVDNGE